MQRTRRCIHLPASSTKQVGYLAFFLLDRPYRQSNYTKKEKEVDEKGKKQRGEKGRKRGKPGKKWKG